MSEENERYMELVHRIERFKEEFKNLNRYERVVIMHDHPGIKENS